MLWLRNGVVYLLSLVLLISLLVGAIVTGVDVNLSKPAKLESWLDQSGIYTGFVNSALKQAQSSTNSSGGGISVSDPAVQTAMKASFPPSTLKQYVATVLDGNYAWLEGKTATPEFSVDLSAAKATFAAQIGQSVTTKTASLPICTPSQAVSESQADPLQATCRPASLTPAAAGTQASQKILSADGFLSKTTITPENLSSNSNNSSQPYYQKLSQAPKAYQFATKLPWLIGVIAGISSLGILFISSRKRKGLRRVASLLIIAGLLLIVSKYAADAGFKQFQKHAFNNTSVGDIQTSLTNFAKIAETHLVNLNKNIGIGYVIFGILLIILLIATKSRKHSQKDNKLSQTKHDVLDEQNDRPNSSPQPIKRPFMDIQSPSRSQSPTGPPKLPTKSATPSTGKRPRLIQ